VRAIVGLKEITDDVKQRKQKLFKRYRTAKQKLTNKENLVRFLHRGKPEIMLDFEATFAAAKTTKSPRQ